MLSGPAMTRALKTFSLPPVTVIPDRARYADISLREQRTRQEAEKDWVRVWSVIVAKESSRRFQTLFFAFLLTILILIILIGWTFWKIHRLLPGGGAKQYFTFTPLGPEGAPVAAKPPEEEGEEEEEEEEEAVVEREPVETEAPPEELEEEEEEETEEL